MKKTSLFFDKVSPIIIAVDGDAGSGKGTLSKKLCADYNLVYCPTSNLYRILAKHSLTNNISDKERILEIAGNLSNFFEEEDLSGEIIGRRASEIASIPEIREALVDLQRDFLKKHKRILMEGRDIGTVIAPEANIKLFITAKLEERAKRRFEEQKQKNKNVEYEQILQDLKDRDQRDKNREVAPLMVAKDAIILDSTNISVDEFYEYVISSIKKIN